MEGKGGRAGGQGEGGKGRGQNRGKWHGTQAKFVHAIPRCIPICHSLEDFCNMHPDRERCIWWLTTPCIPCVPTSYIPFMNSDFINIYAHVDHMYVTAGLSWSPIFLSRHPTTLQVVSTGHEWESDGWWRACVSIYSCACVDVIRGLQWLHPFIQLYEEKYVRCDVECRGAQRDTMATKLKWTKLKWCPTSSLALLK